MTTFTAPVLVRGEVEDGDQHPNVDAGHVLLARMGPVITFADAGNVISQFWLPANAVVWNMYLCITTAFNASGTDLLMVGTRADPDRFGSHNVGAAGSFGRDAVVTNVELGDQRTEIIAQYNGAGTAATTGSARVLMAYFVNETLPG